LQQLRASITEAIVLRDAVTLATFLDTATNEGVLAFDETSKFRLELSRLQNHQAITERLHSGIASSDPLALAHALTDARSGDFMLHPGAKELIDKAEAVRTLLDGIEHKNGRSVEYGLSLVATAKLDLPGLVEKAVNMKARWEKESFILNELDRLVRSSIQN
jgi:hypothetical protein